MRRNLWCALSCVLLSCAATEKSSNNLRAHAEWSYSGPHGPEHWGAVTANYAACAAGQAQSPVDLLAASSAGVTVAAPLLIEFHRFALAIANNGHTVQVNVPTGSQTSFRDDTKVLLQFHFHTPSEHTVGGAARPAEIHFVHKGSGGLAVLGVLVEEGAHNEALDTILQKAPRTVGEVRLEDTVFDATALLPEDRTYFNYAGSLTTPPCTEGVDWNVLVTPIEASGEQLAKLRTLIGSANARPTQRLNGRVLHKVE